MTDLMSGSISYTPSIVADQLIANIVANQSQQATLEQQISTGNAINAPSDNPAGAADILQVNAGLARAQQYAANATDGLGWLSLGNSTMNQVLSALQSAQQAVLSVSSANLTGSSAALQGLATQVDSVRQQLTQLANTQYGGQAIFAGTGNVSAAYDSSGNYVGGGAAPTRTVASGEQIPVSVTGPAVFGTGTTGLLSTTPGSLGVLAQISADLRAGTPAALNQVMTTDLQNLQNAMSQVEGQAAVLGANYQRMQSFQQQATNAQQALQSELSGIQSTNLPQAITQLGQVQNSYQAALWAASKVTQDSLVQFLG
ncbi:MAG TPA: flagellar hook-associated protein FlgL [Acidimicrobiales bacterium]|nr:flagellar hook-associated protein FlgL [Acidimicrobiales bacterium]